MALPDNHHSDLEVVYSQPAHSNLEVDKSRIEQDTYKEAASTVQPRHAYGYDAQPSTGNKRICGLTSKTFYIVAVVVLFVILAAAVGGGVGGSLANKKGSTSASASSSATVAAAAAATTGQSMPASITPAPSPTAPLIVTTTTAYASTTLYPDCPSSNNTVYTVANSDSFLFRKFCGDALVNTDDGFSSVNEQTASLDACIDLCVAYNVKEQSNITSGASPICNSVCWRATIQDDDFPGQCFGFRSTNSSSEFVFSGDNKCDSAA
jgi:hypothetical protein